MQKGITYYRHQPLSEHKINISENLLFEKVGDVIKKLDFPSNILQDSYKEIILGLLEKDKTSSENQLADIEAQVLTLKSRQDKLLDFQLDEKISHEVYLSKSNQIIDEIKGLQEQKSNLKNNDFYQKTQILFELAGSLYQAYFRATDE